MHLPSNTHAAKWTSANLGAGGSCTRTKKLAARSAPQRLAGPPARNCGGCNHRRGAPNDRPQDSTSKPIHPSTAASNSLCPPTSAQRNVTNPPTVSLRQKSRGRGASPPRLRAPTCVPFPTPTADSTAWIGLIGPPRPTAPLQGSHTPFSASAATLRALAASAGPQGAQSRVWVDGRPAKARWRGGER